VPLHVHGARIPLPLFHVRHPDTTPLIDIVCTSRHDVLLSHSGRRRATDPDTRAICFAVVGLGLATRVPMVPSGTYQRYGIHGTTCDHWYHWYTCTSGTSTMVLASTHVRTNITLSQKRLEIQALRCNGETSERCQHRRHHGILRLQLDSDVCSADLHHNPREHVGLHAHQPCITSLRTVSSQWSSAHAGSTGSRPGWALARLAREPSERRASHGPLC
jgi:hypothetical protein